MPRRPEIQEANIILRGHFSPTIFQPSWLASRELLRKSEAEDAKIQIIHRDAVIFSASWLQMQVLEDRFGASTTQAPYFDALRELVLGVFNILDQTPVWGLGINQSFHFLVDSEDMWHRIGHKLAPKELWNTILEKPGLLSLTTTSVRTDNYQGAVNVKVEPSVRYQPGIFIEINDHYQFAKEAEVQPGTEKVLSVLSSNWQQSIARGSVISEAILGLGVS